MSLILSGTNGLSDVDGSAATPAIRGTDTNTGIFFPAADTVGISTGGTERARVDSSGNLGLGTTSPNIGGLTRALTLNTPTGGNYSGVELAGAGTLSARFITNNAAGTFIGSQVSIPLIFETNATERARIDSSGSLLVGKTSDTNTANGVTMRATGETRFTVAGSASNTTIAFFRNGSASEVGSITTTSTATSYVTSSDYRLKEDVQPMSNALARVADLKPCTYKWKSDGSIGEGFIAHELAEVCPHAVTGEKDAVDEDGNPKYQGIDTSFLVATLTAAIKEQQAIIQQLQADVQALKGNA
jgi:hypothetical protein